MRFKSQQKSRALEVNLVPMLDVLMTVLTFFIVVSMTLTVEKGVEIELPNSADTAAPATEAPQPLVVKLSPQGQVAINDKPTGKEQVAAQLQTYLKSNPKGFVVLQADPQMPYDQVIRTLGDLKDIGGDRVSLAIE